MGYAAATISSSWVFRAYDVTGNYHTRRSSCQGCGRQSARIFLLILFLSTFACECTCLTIIDDILFAS